MIINGNACKVTDFSENIKGVRFILKFKNENLAFIRVLRQMKAKFYSLAFFTTYSSGL